MAATRSYRTYEEWKLLWNFYIQQFIPVLTVPMRNGNPYTSLFHLPYFSSSYRTYEEWKLTGGSGTGKTTYGSYRTYEEWKRCWLFFDSV